MPNFRIESYLSAMRQVTDKPFLFWYSCSCQGIHGVTEVTPLFGRCYKARQHTVGLGVPRLATSASDRVHQHHELSIEEYTSKGFSCLLSTPRSTVVWKFELQLLGCIFELPNNPPFCTTASLHGGSSSRWLRFSIVLPTDFGTSSFPLRSPCRV
jgi:hypothetical protein